MAALDALRAHAWPGNVRELRNAVEYMCTVAQGSLIEERHLPDSCGVPSRREGTAATGEKSARTVVAALRPGETLESRLMEVELDLLRGTLETCGWNQSAAARRLGVTESLVRNRMRRYGLRREIDAVPRKEER